MTEREQEILRRMARGLPTASIAEQLFISPVTVRNHIARILSKLDVHTKLAAVAFAYRNGLIEPEGAAPLPVHESMGRPRGRAGRGRRPRASGARPKPERTACGADRAPSGSAAGP